MGKLVTVSAKVPEELRSKMEKLGINISETVREALIREVELRMRSRIIEEFKASKVKRLPRGTIVKMIRDIREES